MLNATKRTQNKPSIDEDVGSSLGVAENILIKPLLQKINIGIILLGRVKPGRLPHNQAVNSLDRF